MLALRGIQTLILPSERRHRESEGAAVPRTDFAMLAERFGATIVYSEPSRILAPVEGRVRFSVSQAVRARRLRPAQVLSLSERVGIPLSLMPGGERHVMVAHLLTSNQKRRLQQATRFLDRVDLTLVFSRPQERYLLDEVGLDPARAAFVYDKVDHTFFVPGPTRPSDTFVLAVGREQRDYRTLVQALTMTGLPGVIVAGSTWSHRSLGELELPAHVRIAQGLSYPELLGLYQRATLVTVPVEPGTDYAAGVNGVLEAMACAVPTIVSDTPGLEGYVEDRVDGWTLPAGEPSVLADAISQLWNDPAERERLGKAGRATVEAGRTIETFADRIAAALGA